MASRNFWIPFGSLSERSFRSSAGVNPSTDVIVGLAPALALRPRRRFPRTTTDVAHARFAQISTDGNATGDPAGAPRRKRDPLPHAADAQVVAGARRRGRGARRAG